MKTWMPLLALAVLGSAFAYEPLLTRRAVVQDPKAIDAFDARMDGIYGKGVMERLATSGDTENNELVNLYLEGALAPAGAALIQWTELPKARTKDVIDFIAAKSKITGADTRALWALVRDGVKWPQLAPRTAEILALFPDSGLSHYKMKYTKLRGLKGNTSFFRAMTPVELMKVTAGILTANDYNMVRQEVLSRCIGAMTQARRAANLPMDVDSFATAMAPILVALDAPMWDGLQAAAAGMLDFTPPDYSGFLAQINQRCDDLDARRISSTTGFAGSVMFWKGTGGFATWTQNYKED